MAQRFNNPQTLDDIKATRDELVRMATVCDALIKSMRAVGVTELAIIGEKKKDEGLVKIDKWLKYAPGALNRTPVGATAHRIKKK